MAGERWPARENPWSRNSSGFCTCLTEQVFPAPHLHEPELMRGPSRGTYQRSAMLRNVCSCGDEILPALNWIAGRGEPTVDPGVSCVHAEFHEFVV